MKNNIPLIIDSIIGVILIIISYFMQIDYYSMLLFAMGFGLFFGSFVHLIRLVYYSQPAHKAEYEQKKHEAHINIIDERKQFIRAKACQRTYQIMFFILLILDVVLAFLHVEAWIIGMIFLLFIAQYLIGTIIYYSLQKKI